MDDDVLAVQRLYPQIFHACHGGHSRSRSNADRISTRDADLLGHLQLDRPQYATELARHLGVGRPTMSAAVQRLERLGYLSRARDADNRRRVGLLLTQHGAGALSRTSVLDAERVGRMLAELGSKERRAAIAGLALLAAASRKLGARVARGEARSRIEHPARNTRS